MVLNPFSALGLASNIVQFVGFSCKLIAECRTIYHSATGSTDENSTLHGIASDLKRMSEALDVSGQRDATPAMVELKLLAVECKRFANEMLNALEKLQAKNPQSKWQSFKAALRQVWSQEQVQKHASQLTALQNQLLIRTAYLTQ